MCVSSDDLDVTSKRSLSSNPCPSPSRLSSSAPGPFRKSILASLIDVARSNCCWWDRTHNSVWKQQFNCSKTSFHACQHNSRLYFIVPHHYRSRYRCLSSIHLYRSTICHSYLPLSSPSMFNCLIIVLSLLYCPAKQREWFRFWINPSLMNQTQLWSLFGSHASPSIFQIRTSRVD